jgi:RES domain-containing protein
MQVYRIASKPFANDLTGEGSRRYGGRWNPPGFPVIYTSESVPLAILELLANVPADFLSSGIFCRVTLDLPCDAISFELTPEELPPNWATNPAPATLAEIGKQWLRDGYSPWLKVPSAVAGGEGWNILLNPLHPGFGQVEVVDFAPFHFDTRLFKNDAI